MLKSLNVHEKKLLKSFNVHEKIILNSLNVHGSTPNLTEESLRL